MAFVKRAGWRLIVLLVGIPVAITPLALMLSGPQRWFVVGAAVSTGLWLDVLLVLGSSGVAGALAGIAAEQWTADDLRSLPRRGWRIVIGLELRPTADIDHVAVGPAGVLGG
jgi:hypothetical protein